MSGPASDREHLLPMSMAGSAIPPDRVVGLVRLKDLVSFLPQLNYMCSSENAKRLHS